MKRLILAEAFREPIPQVATQMAVLIGSISRYDYPQNWVEVNKKNISTIMTQKANNFFFS